MKCPKCGFVSFPGLAACKKCGRPLNPSPDAVSSGSTRFSHLVSLGLAPDAEPRFARLAPAGPTEVVESGEPFAASSDSSLETAAVSSVPLAPKRQAFEPEPPWRESLAERVAHFRNRRVSLRDGGPSDRTLEFDFENRTGDRSFETAAEETDLKPHPGDDPKESGLVAGKWRRSEVSLDAVSLRDAPQGSIPELSGPGGASEWTGEWTGEWSIDARSGRADSSPVEIVLDAPDVEGDPRLDPPLPDSAPLGRRFTAGLLDALILLGAAAGFVMVFWAAGGRFLAQSAELAVAGFVAVFLVLFYFGLFGALALATPGERWCGLMVRNLDGGFPTPQESLWRALGYLVSISALMVGFIWALVDSDGLTWHDRISGTYLGVRD